MKNMLVAVLVLFLVYLLFGGSISGYVSPRPRAEAGQPCGGANHIRCNKSWCSVNPASGKNGTCKKGGTPKWAQQKPKKTISAQTILAGPKML